MQIYALLCCCHCGKDYTFYLPATVNVYLNEEIIVKAIEGDSRWRYIPDTDEWMCPECDHGPAIFKIASETLKKYEHQFRANADQVTWQWDKLVRHEVSKQLGIDSDTITADRVNVKAYMDPHSLAVDFYIQPVGMTWSDLKKRHPIKRSQKTGCLMGDENP